MLMTMQKSIQAHYEAHSGTSYESAYFYSPGDYIDNLVKRVTERLGLGNEHRRILDVGSWQIWLRKSEKLKTATAKEAEKLMMLTTSCLLWLN